MASQFRSYNGNVWMARLTSAMSFGPCLPGVTLAEGSKYIAIIQTALSGIYTMAMIMSVVIYAIILNIPSKPRTESQPGRPDDVFEELQRKLGGGPLIFIVLVSAALVGFACIALHLYLYRAVKQKNARQINNWWWAFVAMSFLNTALFITVLVNGTKSLSFVECLEVLFDLYCLWVVRLFFLELNRQDSVSNQVSVGFAAPPV